jgi:hypothetical protein
MGDGREPNTGIDAEEAGGSLNSADGGEMSTPQDPQLPPPDPDPEWNPPGPSPAREPEEPGPDVFDPGSEPLSA